MILVSPTFIPGDLVIYKPKKMFSNGSNIMIGQISKILINKVGWICYYIHEELDQFFEHELTLYVRGKDIELP